MTPSPAPIPVPPELSAVFEVTGVELEPIPLDPRQILAGSPATAFAVLDVSADGRVERGVWSHTPGITTDVEEDELFVVISGRATVAVEGGPTLELSPGVLGILRAGARTTWTVHETLLKVFQTTV